MTRLSQLVGLAARSPARVPRWLHRVASIGITATDPDVRRRQTFTNIGAYAVAGSTLSHLVINGLWHFWALMPIHGYNLIMASLALLTHRLHRYGETAGAMFLCGLVFVGHNYVVFVLGTDSGLQIYFTLAGAMLFVFGVQNWRLFLSFYAIAFIGLVATFELARPRGVLVIDDQDLLFTPAICPAITLWFPATSIQSFAAILTS